MEDYNSGYREIKETSVTDVPALEDYSTKRLNKSIWVMNARKKKEAVEYLP